MVTKHFYNRKKAPRRIFTDEPTPLQNAIDCAVFLVAIVGIYVLANMIGG